MESTAQIKRLPYRVSIRMKTAHVHLLFAYSSDFGFPRLPKRELQFAQVIPEKLKLEYHTFI